MLIEVWYHKVMNEKSIHAPFVPEQQKFCSARKLPVAGCPRNAWKNCIKSPIEMDPLDEASPFGRNFARSGGVTQAVAQVMKEKGVDFAYSRKDAITRLKLQKKI